jgi:MoaA/NifB/PqqE/SkfB family radical SAM enzyme
MVEIQTELSGGDMSRQILRSCVKTAKREKAHFLGRPSQACLFLTFRCTSRCKMCTMWKKNADQDQELAAEEWKKVLDQCRELGVGVVEFFGGDVLLRADVLVELVRHASSLGLVSYLPTNSHLMTGELAERLVRAGLDFVWFSLDGIGSIHNDVRRVSKSFSKVDQAIRDFRRARGDAKRPFININCVVSRYNLEHFEKVVEYADEAGCDGIDIEYVGQISQESIEKSEIRGMQPTPFFVSPGDGSSALLDWEGAVRLKETIAGLKTPKRFRSDLNIDTGKVDMMSKEEIVAGRYRHRRCYITRSWINMDPYGNMIGCPQYNNYLIGSVRDRPLPSLWRNQRHLDFMEARARGDFAICRFCSMGAGTNNTPWQKIQSEYFRLARTGR